MEDQPATFGGEPLFPGGPPAWPLPDPVVEEAARQALADGSWGRYLGPHVPALEEALTSYFRMPYAVTCASGTLAIEAALRALAIGTGDEVILAGYDYEPNFLTVHAVGARPVLVDVNPRSMQMSVEHLEAAWSPACRAILVSHLHGGWPDLSGISAFAERRGLKLIEDAAQAPGARVGDRPAGSWGDVSVLSFGGSKLLTAGRGGAVLFRDATNAQRAKRWLSRGVQQWAVLTEFQAAILLPQLAQLDARTEQRARRVEQLKQSVADVPGLAFFGPEDAGIRRAYYKVGMVFDESRFGLSREQFVDAMRSEGVAIDEGFRALHVGRAAHRYRTAGPLEHAEQAGRRVVMLHHPVLSLGAEAVETVALAVRRTYRNAHRWSRG